MLLWGLTSMPVKTVLRKIVFSISLIMPLGACKHLGFLFEPPSTLKAVVEGDIKGVAIHCEKTLELGNVHWEVMCKVSDEIDVKYRTKTINNGQTKLEILIDKQSGDTTKTIAAPMVIVSRDKPAILESVTEKGRIAIKTEPIR